MRAIQRFKVSTKPKPDFLGQIELSIDGREFAETVNDFFLQTTRTPWPERSRCYLSADQLKASALSDGKYAIVICANCAHEGYSSCEDLGLDPIEVKHENKTVTWQISWLQWSKKDSTALKLVFDRSEYLKEIGKIRF